MEMYAYIKGKETKVKVTSVDFENKEVEVSAPNGQGGSNTLSIDFDEVELSVSGDTSDGYHTFNELYYHRMMLFAIICNTYKDKAWKSKLHADGTMYDDYFIVGITTEEGNYTYHYHLDNWDYFKVSEIPNSPEWDGHKPEDITRLLTLVGGK